MSQQQFSSGRRKLCGAIALGMLAPMGLVRAQAVQGDGEGEVVRVDAAAGKIAIRQSAIKKLDLPAMTLVYRIDPGLLGGIAAGDKVKFTAQRDADQYRILAIRK